MGICNEKFVKVSLNSIKWCKKNTKLEMGTPLEYGRKKHRGKDRHQNNFTPPTQSWEYNDAHMAIKMRTCWNDLDFHL